MAYEVKYLINGQYTLGDFKIAKGEQKEVSEDVFKYLSETFGDSGWFTFHTTDAKAEPEVEEEPEAKPAPKKRSTRKPRGKKVAESKASAEK